MSKNDSDLYQSLPMNNSDAVELPVLDYKRASGVEAADNKEDLVPLKSQQNELTSINIDDNDAQHASKNDVDGRGRNVCYPQIAQIGGPILRLRNIHKTYLLGLEGVPALRGVSLTIHKGEFIVILGKSGGGKTSMLNIMGTIDKPTKGDLYVDGKRISSATTDSEVAHIRLKKIGFCFQTFNLISSMTALENVELPLILDGQLSASAIKSRAKELLDHMGLSNRHDHLPSQLSGGEQQRVTIARAIANNPAVLLLDEPTGDLDTKNSNIVMDVLVRLNRTQGITCVFVTHDVSLKYFAHRVIHMLDGKISRIETVSNQKRAQAEHELKNSLGVGQVEEQGLPASTEVREPLNFYAYHRWRIQQGGLLSVDTEESAVHGVHGVHGVQGVDAIEAMEAMKAIDAVQAQKKGLEEIANDTKGIEARGVVEEEDDNSVSPKKGEDSSHSGNMGVGDVTGANEVTDRANESGSN